MSKLLSLFVVATTVAITATITKLVCDHLNHDANIWKGWEGDVEISFDNDKPEDVVTVNYEQYRDIITLGIDHERSATQLVKRMFDFHYSNQCQAVYDKLCNMFSGAAVKREVYENDDFSVIVDGIIIQEALNLSLHTSKCDAKDLIEKHTGLSYADCGELLNMFIEDNIDADDDCRVIKSKEVTAQDVVDSGVELPDGMDCAEDVEEAEEHAYW